MPIKDPDISSKFAIGYVGNANHQPQEGHRQESRLTAKWGTFDTGDTYENRFFVFMDSHAGGRVGLSANAGIVPRAGRPTALGRSRGGGRSIG